jgi:hypothetical protein
VELEVLEPLLAALPLERLPVQALKNKALDARTARNKDTVFFMFFSIMY